MDQWERDSAAMGQRERESSSVRRNLAAAAAKKRLQREEEGEEEEKEGKSQLREEKILFGVKRNGVNRNAVVFVCFFFSSFHFYERYLSACVSVSDHVRA